MQQLRIVWFAMLVTQLVFPVILFTVVERPDTADDVTVVALVAVALFEAAMSVAWGRVVATTPATNRPIVRWALAESVTLIGFALGLLGGPPIVVGCLMAIGFVLVLAQPPREAFPG